MRAEEVQTQAAQGRRQVDVTEGGLQVLKLRRLVAGSGKQYHDQHPAAGRRRRLAPCEMVM